MSRSALGQAAAIAVAFVLAGAAGDRMAVAAASWPPVLAPEPAYTTGTTNTLYWQPVGGWDALSTNRHYDILVRDDASGAERTIAVAGSQTGSHTVTASEFPAPPSGRTFSYWIRASEHQCATSDVVTDTCYAYQWLTSEWSGPVTSTQDATPPVLGAVVLAGGAAYTSSRHVSVHLDATDPGATASGLAEMHIALDPSFSCPILGRCSRPFVADSSIDLATGPDGVRTVYARVYDAAKGPTGAASAAGSRVGAPTGNASNIASGSIVLDTIPPMLVVARTPETEKAGEPVTFDASRSSDDGGFHADSGVDAGSVIWDFGDGTKGSGIAVSHTYAAAGTYTARLSLHDNAGNAATAAVQVTITAPMDSGTSTRRRRRKHRRCRRRGRTRLRRD